MFGQGVAYGGWVAQIERRVIVVCIFYDWQDQFM